MNGRRPFRHPFRFLRSLRWRLLLSLLAAMAVAAAITGGLTYRTVLGEAESLFDYQLRQMALSLRDQGAIAPDEARALADEQLDFVVQIWSVDGRSIYASRRHSALPEQAVLGYADMWVESQVWRTYGVAAGNRIIQVAQPERIRRGLAANAAWRSIAPIGWLALPLAALLWWLVDLVILPLRRMAKDVRQRGETSLTPLTTTHLPDEVQPLVRALNDLLRRLQESLRTQRAFVADAAHELRSPLTALKLQLRALKDARQPGEHDAAVAALAAGIDRAARLVEQLLALARNEPGAAEPEMRPLDLAELAGEALAELWPLAQTRHITLALEGDESLPMTGDRAGLFALIRNLVDNAIRYGRDGGNVKVTVCQQPVEAEASNILLTVDDDGPGIPEAERERVFSRFWRRDSGQADGTGLGLAIVQAVAQRHLAQLRLTDSTTGGLRVEVRLPTHAAAQTAPLPQPSRSADTPSSP